MSAYEANAGNNTMYVDLGDIDWDEQEELKAFKSHSGWHRLSPPSMRQSEPFVPVAEQYIQVHIAKCGWCGDAHFLAKVVDGEYVVGCGLKVRPYNPSPNA